MKLSTLREQFFFYDSDRSVVLIQVAHVPRSQDLAIFMLTTDDEGQNRFNLLYPLCMRMGCAMDSFSRFDFQSCTCS